jgi:hypothetical protein
MCQVKNDGLRRLTHQILAISWLSQHARGNAIASVIQHMPHETQKATASQLIRKPSFRSKIAAFSRVDSQVRQLAS